MSGAHTTPVVGRLAPSPTGHLHLGHAWSFLCAWWSARSQGGRIVLRIEDLDAARAKPGLVDDCLRDLEWLGLDWDEGPLLQSDEVEAMHDAVARLLAEGRAFACTCTRKEIAAALSAPHGGELRYPGTCRDRWSSPEEAEAATGRAAGVRFRVEPGAIELEDDRLGRFATDVAAEVGDFLVARRDGLFAYQLAVVVDDARQGVSEVVRGEDLLPSTARQYLLQEALGLPHPRWLHLPLVVDEAGRRLAKRQGDATLAELRAAGVDPRILVTWLAQRAGAAVEGRARPAELVDRLVPAHIPRSPLVFSARERATLVAGRAPSDAPPGR